MARRTKVEYIGGIKLHEVPVKAEKVQVDAFTIAHVWHDENGLVNVAEWYGAEEEGWGEHLIGTLYETEDGQKFEGR